MIKMICSLFNKNNRPKEEVEGVERITKNENGETVLFRANGSIKSLEKRNEKGELLYRKAFYQPRMICDDEYDENGIYRIKNVNREETLNLFAEEDLIAGTNKYFDENGDLIISWESKKVPVLLEGIKIGDTIAYHGKTMVFNGKTKILDCDFVNDELSGKVIRYHDNGEVKSICEFNDDHLVGDFFDYNVKGKLVNYFDFNGYIYDNCEDYKHKFNREFKKEILDIIQKASSFAFHNFQKIEEQGFVWTKDGKKMTFKEGKQDE